MNAMAESFLRAAISTGIRKSNRAPEGLTLVGYVELRLAGHLLSTNTFSSRAATERSNPQMALKMTW
jgi:hypothetical protein